MSSEDTDEYVRPDHVFRRVPAPRDAMRVYRVFADKIYSRRAIRSRKKFLRVQSKFGTFRDLCEMGFPPATGFTTTEWRKLSV